MPVEIEFASVLEAAPNVVWDRVVRVSGANDELWPFAKMTAPSFADRLTGPGHGRLPAFRSWFLLFGVIPNSLRGARRGPNDRELLEPFQWDLATRTHGERQRWRHNGALGWATGDATRRSALRALPFRAWAGRTQRRRSSRVSLAVPSE
jgi:hypothetical protein